ncbi:MAG: serine--tRNA ligase [Phycisphaerales bacterium]|nr:MAG: serine--tRNA ligase [Phycisphaerales bacterium]
MLDIKFIRENQEAIRDASRRKKVPCDLDRLVEVDARRRQIQVELDRLRHEQKEGGAQLALYRNPKSPWRRRAAEEGVSEQEIAAETERLQARLNEIKAGTKALEEEDRQVQADFQQLMLTVPQTPAADVPDGEDETDNRELRRVGEVPKLDFPLLDHVELGAKLGIVDIERGVRLAGTRNYMLRGAGTLLHQAVLRFAFDLMIQRGFEPVTVPVMVKEEVMQGTGYFPLGRDQAYLCERDELSLVGTAEVPLTALHTEEILDETDLPKRYVALSPCFRREAGAAGKDTYGLYRIHLFDKVEQVIICRNDEAVSLEHHQEILAHAEAVMQALELPYRVVNVCTGDLGQGQVQKFDIETWMPSRGAYCETHSASRFHEFQARRLNMRYRDASRKIHFCHTLNNTVIASPRVLIPILELYQQPDGSIVVPKVLRPYMGDMERIGPR